MGSRKRTPGTTSSAGALAAQRQLVGAVRIALTERGRLTVGELDPDSDVSKQLALVVRQQLLGSGRIDQAALRGVVASANGIVLVAESDERLGFPVDEIARLLGEIAAHPPGLDADEWHAGGASLLRPERVCDPGRVSTGKEEQARAIALRRTAVGLGAEGKQQGTRAEGPGTGAEPAWSDLLNVPNLPEHIIGPLAEVAGAFREISSLSSPDPGRLVPLLERIGDAVSKIIEPLAGVAPEGRDAPPKLVEIRIAEVAPATPGREAADSGQLDRERRAPIATTPGEPLRRDGHRLVEDLAALWDERETIERPELVRRFQKLLDRFHDAKSLGSYETNKLATQWVNKLASKNSIKMMLGDTAVTILCADRGEAGFYLPRHAKGKSAAIKGAGSYEFPPVKAIAL